MEDYGLLFAFIYIFAFETAVTSNFIVSGANLAAGEISEFSLLIYCWPLQRLDLFRQTHSCRLKNGMITQMGALSSRTDTSR